MLYKFVPLVAATKLKNVYPVFGNQMLFNVVDGVIRIALFLLFIWGTSLWPDMRRVYQYHGAEHKTVFAFESHDPLTTEQRAGVFDLSSALRHQLPDDRDADLIVVYMLFPVHGFWAKFALRIALLPVIAGVSYEMIRFAAKHGSSLFALHDQARPVAAADHHPASQRRPGGMRHHRAERSHGAGKSSRRRTGDCLAAPAAKNSFLHILIITSRAFAGLRTCSMRLTLRMTDLCCAPASA